MSEEEAEVYLGAINASMSSPNMILDLRIPQNQKYQQVVLDEAISRFLVRRDRRGGHGQGGRRPAGTSSTTRSARDEQLEIYKATIGAPESSRRTAARPPAAPAASA